jgi:hypothetical protein
MIHKQIFLAKLQKKSHFTLIFSEKRLQKYVYDGIPTLLD